MVTLDPIVIILMKPASSAHLSRYGNIQNKYTPTSPQSICLFTWLSPLKRSTTDHIIMYIETFV
jgi:hypothetical protein